MQHLSDIRIHNFKGLASVELLECGQINALVGKNNSGKSSILHAIDMAGLALEVNAWSRFQPKLQIRDLFSDVGAFSIEMTYSDGSTIKVAANPNCGPTKSPAPREDQQFKSILIWPDVSAGMRQRHHKTPSNIMQQLESRDFGGIDALEMLFAIKYYAFRGERGLTPAVYTALIEEVRNYFPDIEELDLKQANPERLEGRRGGGFLGAEFRRRPRAA